MDARAAERADATLLAFDTSSEWLAVAVGTSDGDSSEVLAGGPVASAALMPALQRLMRSRCVEWHQVSAIAFGRGPGAFTGLRTSCAVAQGLALGLRRPTLPIDSLLIVAQQAWAQNPGAEAFDIGVAVDARMGEVYAARYLRNGGWQVLEAPALCTPAELLVRWQAAPPGWLAGSGVPLLGEALSIPAERRIVHEVDRGAALLELARQAWARGEGSDAAEALPLYLRDKVALTSAERAAARQA